MLGRATILLLLSQFFLLASGYTINVGLARMFGPEDFGTFGLVMSFLLVIQLFVITGIPIALQKFIAENLNASKLIFRKTLPWHLMYSIGVWLVFWFSAPVISRWFADAGLEALLQIASFDIIVYGLYKYYLSLHNGLHEFTRQTIAGIAYSVAKVGAIFGLVFLDYSVKGAIIGNMLGSVGGLLVGIWLIRFPEVSEELGDIPFFKFAFTNVFYYVGLQLLFSIDIWAVKYYLSAQMVGQYVSAASIAKIPYFLSLAISSALLPSISRATKSRDDTRVREIVMLALRYWLMLLLAMVVVVSSISPALILFFFGEAYREAGPVLTVLFAAVAIVTFFAVMNTVLIARDKLKPCLAVTAILITVHISANIVLVPRFSVMGAASATAAVAFLGLVLTTWLLLKNVNVVMSLSSAFRMVSAGISVLALAYFVPNFETFFLLKSLLVLAVFVLLLFLTRELSMADLKRAQAILAPGR